MNQIEIPNLTLLNNEIDNNNYTNSSRNGTDIFQKLWAQTTTFNYVFGYFALIFTTLCLLLSIINIIIYTGIYELRSRKNYNLIISFTICEILVMIKHLIILIVFFFNFVESPGDFLGSHLCVATTILDYVFNFAAYFWGFCIVIDLVTVIRNPIKVTKKLHYLFHFLTWFLSICFLISILIESFEWEEDPLTKRLSPKLIDKCSLFVDMYYTSFIIYLMNGILAIISIIICIYIWIKLRKGLPGTQSLRNGIIIRQCLFSVVIALSVIIMLPHNVIFKFFLQRYINELNAPEFILIIGIAAIGTFTLVITFHSLAGVFLALILLSDLIIKRHFKRFYEFLLMLTENENGINIIDRIKGLKVASRNTSDTSSKNPLYLQWINGGDGRSNDDEMEELDNLYKKNNIDLLKLFEGIMEEPEEEQIKFFKFLERQDRKLFEDDLSNICVDYMIRRDLIFCILFATQHSLNYSLNYSNLIKRNTTLNTNISFNNENENLNLFKSSKYSDMSDNILFNSLNSNNDYLNERMNKILFSSTHANKEYKNIFCGLTKHLISITEYYPLVFHQLRFHHYIQQSQQEDNENNERIKQLLDGYKRSFEPTSVILESVRNNFSEGKSGSFFLFTYDSQFMIKTITNDELKLLLENIKLFYKHYTTFKDTFIMKIFGIYELKMTESFKIKFIVINNALNINNLKKENISHQFENTSILCKFDLKGSWINRSNLKVKKHHQYLNTLSKQTITFQDEGYPINSLLLDYDFHRKRKLVLEDNNIYLQLINQINIDSNFLKSLNIMDYSLLIGIIEDDPTIHYLDNDNKTIPIYQPFYKNYKGGIEAVDVDVVYNRRVILYISIIDILQEFNLNKKLETFIKTKFLRKDPKGISSVEPQFYATRFQQNVLSKFSSRLNFYKQRANTVMSSTVSNNSTISINNSSNSSGAIEINDSNYVVNGSSGMRAGSVIRKPLMDELMNYIEMKENDNDEYYV
ncbi:hypothetical protein ABK040_010867 [Willaertia magna]